MDAVMPKSKTYRFGPLEKKGLIFGLRAGQLGILGAGLLFAVLLMQLNSALFFIGVVLIAVVLFLGVFAQPWGRGIDEWAPIAWRWFRNGKAARSWISEVPLMGVEINKRGKVINTPIALPPTLETISILEVPIDNGGMKIGVLKDSREGTYTGVIAVRGSAFALLESSEKERRLQSWGDVLGGLARPGSAIHTVQWIERTLPDDGDALNRYFTESKKADDHSPFVHSYVDLLEEYGPQNQQHEIYISLQIHAAKKAARAIRKSGNGDEGAARVLIRELKQLAFRLNEADITVEGVLTPRMLSRVFRTAVDPLSARQIARRGRKNPEERGVAPHNAWPLSTETSWAHYQTENAFHVTYWISEWPRLEVSADFMAPLMLRSSRIRTVSLVMEPVDSTKAAREVESRHTSFLADEELRNRAGYVQTKRRTGQIEAVQRREAELASGYVEFRMSGYVTVTAFSLDELDEACNEVEQIAQQSRLELRRLYGEQDWAFTCTLPTARGIGKAS